MTTKETILTLRHGGHLNMWDKANKLFVRIQPNKNESFVCWERWVRASGGRWINWNKDLSLHDIVSIRKQIAETNQN